MHKNIGTKMSNINSFNVSGKNNVGHFSFNWQNLYTYMKYYP